MFGTDKKLNREEIEAFAKKHKVALIVGAVVIALMMMSEGGNGSYTAENGPPQAPVYDGGGGGGGEFDMDRWREEQRRDDRAQRDRIDSIREVERCYDPETGRTVEVSIHAGC